MTYLYCTHCKETTEHYYQGELKDKDVLFKCSECMRAYRYHRTTLYSMPAEGE